VATLDEFGAEADLSWVALESPGLCRGVPFPDAVSGSFLTHLLVGTVARRAAHGAAPRRVPPTRLLDALGRRTAGSDGPRADRWACAR
jgi:hypothetical protein